MIKNIRTYKLLFLFIFFIKNIGLAQVDSLSIEQVKRTTSNYKSFVTVNDKIFAITDSGKVVIWDLNKLDTVHFTNKDTSIRYTAISKDRHNQVFIGTNKGNIYKVDPTTIAHSLFLHDKYFIHSICFNSKNEMFLIVPFAVYKPSNKKYWRKFENHARGIVARKKVLGLFWKKTDNFLTMPQFAYLDNTDRWWMCSSYGEFGGEAQIFDTKNEKVYNNKFDSISPGLFFPKSVFNDQLGNVYITSGLQHFSDFGEIYKIATDGTVTKIFESKDFRDTTKQKGLSDGIFVGPGAYNQNDNYIYFATAQGFYKAVLPTTGKIKNLTLLFNPTLSWEQERLAIGVGMAIKEIKFTANNKLIFLTSNDGFGIYTDKKLIMLK